MASEVIALPPRTFSTIVWRTLVEPSSEWTGGDYVRSSPFQLFGLAWALEVYPSGCSGSPGSPAAELCLVSPPQEHPVTLEGTIHAWKDRGNAFLASVSASSTSVVVPRIGARSFPGNLPLVVTLRARVVPGARSPAPPANPHAWSALRGRERLPADATVEADDGTVPLHLWAAACACPKLFQMLREAPAKVPGKVAWVSAVVDSLYTGQLGPFTSVEDTVGILSVATFLEMDLLRSSCEFALRTRISPANVCTLLRAAAAHSLPGLAAEASRCLGKNFVSVEKTEGWAALTEVEKDMIIRELCSWAAFVSTGGNIAQ
jgi:hypothetical protein